VRQRQAEERGAEGWERVRGRSTARRPPPSLLTARRACSSRPGRPHPPGFRRGRRWGRRGRREEGWRSWWWRKERESEAAPSAAASPLSPPLTMPPPHRKRDQHTHRHGLAEDMESPWNNGVRVRRREGAEEPPRGMRGRRAPIGVPHAH
jgi:hypothetical protein